MSSFVLAGPANPEPIQIAQPDGTKFLATMRGDEFQGWMETSDGQTIIKNPTSGFFEYASQNADGGLIPTGLIVSAASRSNNAMQSLLPPKGLRPRHNIDLELYKSDSLDSMRERRAPSGMNAAQAQSVSGIWAPTPVTGPKKILVILVNFLDASLSVGAATYWSAAVHSPTGSSVAKYYQDNSFSKISIAPVAHTQSGGSPAGVVTVSLGQNHPGCGGSCSYATEAGWINNALSAASPYVNFAALDTNGDGIIAVDETLIYFILAGHEASASGSSPSIWAHAWGGSGVGVSGKSVNHWALNGEMYNASTRMAMGVIAHEMGHAMGGLPDLYDIHGKNQGLGIFSLMAGGSWGRRSGEVGGTTPVGLDAWSRQYLGWSTPQPAVNGSTFSFVSGLASPNSALMLTDSASTASEYWLVENRPPVGWDAGMSGLLGSWAGGLLIQHIDLNIGTKYGNSFNAYVAGSHQGNLAEEPSTATCSLQVVSIPSTASPGCPTILYHSGSGGAFNPGSAPNSSYYSGAASGLGINGISAAAPTMTANVVVVTPTNYTLSVTKSGAGTGSVASSPAGISCGTSCSASYVAGSVVSLIATPTGSGIFTGWSGACTGTGACSVTMSAAQSVTASFAAGTIVTPISLVNLAGATSSTQTYSVTVPARASNLVIKTSGGVGDVDLYVRASAAPSTSLYDCRPWLPGNNEICTFATPLATTYYIMLDGYSAYSGVSLTVSYSVAAPTVYTVAINKAGSGAGTLTSSPAGISCGSVCSATFAADSVMTLTATPAAGSVFEAWSGACSGSGICALSVNTSKSIGASFRQVNLVKSDLTPIIMLLLDDD